MKTFTFGFFLATLGFVTTAQAFPSLEKVKQQMMKSPKTASQFGPRKFTNDCSNFSGTWIGSCSDGDADKPETIVIEQYQCDQISVDGEDFSIGGSDSNVQSSSVGTFSFTTTADWSAKKDRLNIKFNINGRAFGTSSHFEGQGTARMYLSNDSLVMQSGIQWTSTLPDGTTDIGGNSDSCWFKKSQ